jgi:RNA polymerase sigma-70 factor (ECF subfamily)
MKRGDRKAAAALYDALSPKVYGFLFTRTGEKEIAEDLAQHVFIKLIDKVGSFDPERGRFTVWFWQMVRNVLIDHYREKRAVPFSAFEDDVVEGFAVAGTTNLEEKLEYNKIELFMRTLASNEQEIFELRYVAEMPYKEIAAVLSKSEGSLRVTALRVKEKIRREFESVR